jgi:N-methylhydantoinase B
LRDPQAVKEDVAGGYVTPEGARRDYGVVVREVDAELAEWNVDEEATEEERTKIRENRVGWLETDPEELAQRYRDGKVDTLTLIRRHGVILDWGTGELLPKTTEGFRAMLKRRAVPHWENGTPKD